MFDTESVSAATFARSDSETSTSSSTSSDRHQALRRKVAENRPQPEDAAKTAVSEQALLPKLTKNPADQFASEGLLQ